MSRSIRFRTDCTRAVAMVICFAPLASAQNWFGAPRVFVEPGQTLCPGDLDGDGDIDVLRFQFPNIVVPHLNTGTGDFELGTSFSLDAVSNVPFDSIALGDIDCDGILDLALARQIGSTHGVAIHRGLGSALFASSVFVPIAQVSQLRVGDFNGDGCSDLVGISGSVTKTVHWIHWNGASFQVTAAAFFFGSSGLFDLATGDLDSDGRDDVAFSDLSTNVVNVVRSTLSGLALGPSFSIGSPSSATFVGVACGDIEGDGDDDLLISHRVATGSSLPLMRVLNQGGTLVASPTQTVPGFGFTQFPIDTGEIEFADIDSDGDLDIGGMTKLASQSSSGARFTRLENLGSTFGSFHTIPATQFGRGGGFADFDADGHLDYLTNISIVFGDGTFVSPLSGDLPSGTSIASSELLDLEGDGDLDVLDISSGALNDASGSFSATGPLFPTAPSGFAYAQDGVRGDFDGDGRLDFLARYLKLPVLGGDPLLFLETRLLRDDHTGNYVDVGAAASPGVTLGDPDSLRGDFDSDGDLDVLGTLGLARNQGGGFFDAPFLPFAGTPTDAQDVDADGDLDVMTVLGNELVLQRKGTGLLWTAETIHQPNPTKFVEAVAVFADLDADGDSDVVAPSVGLLYPSNLAAFVELLRNDSGAFTFVQSLSIGAHSRRHVGHGDVDGDGLTDLGFADDSGSVTILRQGATAWSFDGPRQFQTLGAVAFGDIDSDLDLDLVGNAVLVNSSLTADDSGAIQQYGSGTVGSGGAVPVLGARGPAAIASTTFEIRVRRAVGGAPSFLHFSPTQANLPNLPLLGMTLYVGIPFSSATFPASGSPGAPGDGELTLAIPSLPPVLQGVSVYLQTWHVDAGALFGASQSNGLAIDFR